MRTDVAAHETGIHFLRLESSRRNPDKGPREKYRARTLALRSRAVEHHKDIFPACSAAERAKNRMRVPFWNNRRQNRAALPQMANFRSNLRIS
jgi:hypothetical protein